MGTSLISNPPYNLKHKLPDLANFMPRYMGWTLPPESNANFAFVLSGLELISSRAVFLLPNGVLTSTQKDEKAIRAQLIKSNLLLAVITLPGNMFESTSIPTCLLVFDRHKDTQKIALIDLSEVCEEETRLQRGQFGGESHTKRVYSKAVKVVPLEVMQKCMDLIDNKKDDEKLCIWVSPFQIEENDFNLSPKRYFEFEADFKHRPFEDIATDYNRIVRQKNAIKIRMNKTVAKRLGYDCMNRESIDLSESFSIVGQKVEKENNITFSANDGISITISTKEDVHPLVLDFLNHWKQMIMYLNSEENRVLAEFRDALLHELMSGNIDLQG